MEKRTQVKDGLTFLNKLNQPYITADQVDKLREILREIKEKGSYKNTKKVRYYNIPCAFDIETTSVFRSPEGKIISAKQWAQMEVRHRWDKIAFMYIWQLGIDGRCIIGRTWEEYEKVLEIIQDELNLYDDQRIIIYVHNLSHEFQYLKKRFEWDHIFATKPYEVLYAVSGGVEYRCSSRNSGKNLALLGESLVKYKVKKLVGDLDYDLIRHSGTPITAQELGYCLNDIKVVMAYIQEQIEIEGHADKIPLTMTGYVRRDTKKECFYGDKKTKKERIINKLRYREVISGLTLDPDVFGALQDAMAGGFTHGNALYVREVLEGVAGVDIASAYPTEICSNGFPMSPFKKRKIESSEQFKTYINRYCCLARVRIEGLRLKEGAPDAYISRSHCNRCSSNVTIDNGKVREADYLEICLTDVDVKICWNVYEWDRFQVSDFWTALRGYLPKPIIKATLKYYAAKTRLKGVKGREQEYMLSKNMLNSIFGMMLTGVINPEVTMTDSGMWEVSQNMTIEEALDKYNTSQGRFLFWAWGCWITAYCRLNVWKVLLHIGEDFVYSDTDSVKLKNYENHKEFFERYNKNKVEKIDKCLRYYGLDPDSSRPKDPKGKTKQMGVYEFEGYYQKFKTLGAKRYMYMDDEGLHLTCAGLSKRNGLDYLMKEYGPEKIWQAFDNDLHIDGLHTGKLTHTYIEDTKSALIEDYTGQVERVEELSSVHLAPADFSISMTADFISLIMSLQYRAGWLEWV